MACKGRVEARFPPRTDVIEPLLVAAIQQHRPAEQAVRHMGPHRPRRGRHEYKIVAGVVHENQRVWDTLGQRAHGGGWIDHDGEAIMLERLETERAGG